ncbi:MAG: MGH1-like glycoside hydrolase domain-containing protein [Gemmatimonadota bacterium]
MTDTTFATTPARFSSLIDPIELLARNDKWYLGSGDGIIFAPSFPQWLDAPGFWDEATFYQYQLGPLYTVSWLDESGRELPLRILGRRWTPAELTVTYELPDDIHATEVRSVQPRGVFASEWSLSGPRAGALHAVAWTAQDTTMLDLNASEWNAALSVIRRVTDRRDVACDVRMELAAVGEVSSWSASLSERTAIQPHWRFAPFAELWYGERLPSRFRIEGVSTDGLLYAGVHVAVAGGAREATAAFAMRLSPLDHDLGGGRAPTPLGVYTIRSRRTPSPVSSTPVVQGSRAPTQPMARASRRRWHQFFEAAPSFQCSDPYLERYYYYRLFGLHLNSVQPGRGNYRWPTVCEGPGFFHQPITYSAQCHVRELRWLHDPAPARGVLRTIFEHQKPNGGLHGRVYVNHLSGTDFYHANWGDAVGALDEIHPDASFLDEIYPRLARYADWLVTTRDRGGDGMIDVVDQYETGQEYMSRYQAVDDRADAYGWENRIRLKGIDVTVYACQLYTRLAEMASRRGEPHAAAQWSALAERTRFAVRDRMWNPRSGMFSDVDPRTGNRTDVRAAVSFYPYFTDIATEEHIEGLTRNLLDPGSFWTHYPVPSSALDDPEFSAIAEWKGKRHACPWNGRVWPMTNSHIMEALGRWATPDRPAIREAAGHFLRRFIHMMFHAGDLNRPNCFEHYNPLSGAPSEYRGIDDYQHSWVLDLIIRYACGVRPGPETIVIDPLPMDLDSFELRELRIGDDVVTVRLDHGHVTATVNDGLHLGRIGEPIVITR